MRDHSLGGDAPIVDADAKPDLYEIHIRGVLTRYPNKSILNKVP